MRRPAIGSLLVFVVLSACDATHQVRPDPLLSLDPGFVTAHRLNRAEYNNTVRELLHTDLAPADDFPVDDRGSGFDNIADVLSLSPLQIELYDRAADLLVKDLLRIDLSTTIEVESLGASTGSRHRDWGWRLWQSGVLGVEVVFPEAGAYRIAVRAFGERVGAALPTLDVAVEGEEPRSIPIEAQAGAAKTYTLSVSVASGGLKRVGLSLANPVFDGSEFRSVVLDWIRFEGPDRGRSRGREAIFVCEPDPADHHPCAEEIIGRFAKRAFRRPVAREDVARLVSLADTALRDGGSFEAGIGLAIHAILISPRFLFRVEIDPDPSSPVTRYLDDHELASRLSYFLWSTMPDDTLFDLADRGALRDEAVLRAEIQRMLEDPRSRALTENFAGQWLFIRALQDIAPDVNAFPGFDPELRASMRTESALFFREFLTGDRPLSQMLTASFTYVDSRLREHYGFTSAPKSDAESESDFERIDLGGTERRGFLTQGTLLSVTSYPTRTSIVQRGKWVLEQLLCLKPPPPPPGVDAFKEQVVPEASLRERFEAHRSQPVCKSCHAMMDPIGFALEHFDGIGRWRDDDAGFAIDASGTFPDGTAFDGAREMAEAVSRHPQLPSCVAQHMYVYALGRGLAAADGETLPQITERFLSDGGRLKDLIAAIVLSPGFRLRKGEP